MRTVVFCGLLIIFVGMSAPMTFAAETCPVEGGEAVSDALEAAPTCKVAGHLLELCSFASSMDVQLSETVIDKCEKDFLAGLSKARLAAYQKERAACDRKYAHQQGSMYVGFTATCNAKVAVKYSGK